MYEDVLNDIRNAQPSAVNDELKDLVISRLGSLGYTVNPQSQADNWKVDYAIQKTQQEIKSYCNISTIPDELTLVEVEMICGNFLLDKANTTDLASTLNLEDALASVTLGDTSVSFSASDSADTKIKNLIGSLLNHSEELICYRKLKW